MEKSDKNMRPQVGGVDRSGQVDKIAIQNAIKTPFWMAVWAAEPNRPVDVRMSYSDLKTICDLVDEISMKNIAERQAKPGVRDMYLSHLRKEFWIASSDLSDSAKEGMLFYSQVRRWMGYLDGIVDTGEMTGLLKEAEWHEFSDVLEMLKNEAYDACRA